MEIKNESRLIGPTADRSEFNTRFNFAATSGLPFTVGEKLVIPATKEAISTVMERDPSPVMQAIPLSNDSGARRIKEMALDAEQQSNWLKTQQWTIMLAGTGASQLR